MPKVQKRHDAETLAKQRLNDKEVESGLRAIYGDQETDFSKLEKRTWSLSRFLGHCVIVLGSISVLTWAGYFAYLKLVPKPTASDLRTEIETNENVQSGMPAEIVFNYQNPKRAPLANLSVRAQLPDTFIITSSIPGMADSTEKSWDLGALDGEAKGTIVLKGNWIAPVPSKQPLQFVSTYRPSNFNAEFTDVESMQVTIEKSVAELTVKGPESLAAGEVGTFEFAVRNTATEVLPEAELQLTLPEGFFLETAIPELTKDLPPAWEIKDLPAGGEAQFTLKGSFASGAGGFTPFTGTLAFVKDDQRLVQDTKTHTTDIAAGDVKFDLSLNGNAGSASVAPGATIDATILIENTTNSRISNASVLLDFRSEGKIPIRWSTFDYDGGKLTTDGVLWDPATIGALEPGEKLILSPSFEINGTITASDAKQLDMILHVKRGSGDLKSDIYKLYIGEEAQVNAVLKPSLNGGATEKELTVTFSPPPQPLEDVLLTLEFAQGMLLFETMPLSVGTSAFVVSDRQWKWRIPHIPANSTPLTAQLFVGEIPDDWDERIFLHAIDPETLEEIDISAVVTRQE